ncbi:DUF1642 domain-containing protein [Listeria monocytogenes]|nr:DUF1642 domain-containing protein [Listeria monocytogenes]EIZ2814145.1 DUF1642 domain-containing protein [Listeria monocytogenes]EIZ2817033.1 DUF1642 domain-containing protein [Listeria monocytogenes]EJH5250463.1 DUF1642 domain-containing protein [Listeria monocytogenes]MCW41979.1 DUF1642 domain-containing protein [Listeria monocytogenes]
MEKLEREGCIWGNDNLLTKLKHKWTIWRKDTVIIVTKGALAILPKSRVTNDKLIVKYTKESKIKSKVPVVPQFVADWYEDNKDDLEYKIWEYIRNWDEQDCYSNFYDFMDYDYNEPIETILKMQYGYEVEKEQLYYVQLIDNSLGYLNERNDGRRSLSDTVQHDIFKTQFTEAEIKEMDERYWQFAVPVEEVSK